MDGTSNGIRAATRGELAGDLLAYYYSLGHQWWLEVVMGRAGPSQAYWAKTKNRVGLARLCIGPPKATAQSAQYWAGPVHGLKHQIRPIYTKIIKKFCHTSLSVQDLKSGRVGLNLHWVSKN